MKKVSLSGALRADVGKKDAKKNRKEGKVPCIIYGGKAQVPVLLDQLDFKKVLFTPEVFIFEIEAGGKKYDTILQDVQYHPTTDEVIHADFLELTNEKPVTLAIPVKLEGTAPGVIKGGKLRLKLRRLKVKGLIEKMPDNITLDISKLDIGRSIKVREINIDGLQFLDPTNAVVVSVKTARGAVVEGEAEETEETED